MPQCHDTYPATGSGLSQVQAVPGTQCHDPYPDDRCTEDLLADAVRAWARKAAPDDEQTVRAGVDRALRFYAYGASASEAYREARNIVLCRLHHPSHGQRTNLANAS